jgi:hypothetical protein
MLGLFAIKRNEHKILWNGNFDDQEFANRA